MNTENVTRLEIIDHKGRTVIFRDENKKIELSLQDDDRTLKIFVNDRTDKVDKLARVRRDLDAMAFNYFYAGWEYRVKEEGYDAVAKDCNISANNIITEFERLTKEVYEDTRNK